MKLNLQDYKNIVESLNEGIIILNKDNRILYANKYTQNLLSTNLKNLINIEFKSLFPKKSSKEVNNCINSKKSINDIEIYDKKNQKHFINTKLVEIMEYRQSRKWYVSIAVVGLFSFILALMIFFMAQGKDVTEGWKEILLGSFKIKDFPRVIERIKNWFKSNRGFRKINNNLVVYSPIFQSPFPIPQYHSLKNQPVAHPSLFL